MKKISILFLAIVFLIFPLRIFASNNDYKIKFIDEQGLNHIIALREDGKLYLIKDKKVEEMISDNVKKAYMTQGDEFTIILMLKDDNALYGYFVGDKSKCSILRKNEDYDIKEKELIKIIDDIKDFEYSIESCFVIKNDNTLWGWGSNYKGSLGIGNTKEQYIYSPQRIADDVKTIHDVGNNYSHFLVKNDNTLWFFGG